MRKVAFLFGLMALFACAGSAWGVVALNETFDSYADQAAFEAAWTKQGVASMSLLQGFDSDIDGPGTGNSVNGICITNYTFRNWRTLDAAVVNEDGGEVVFEIDLYIDPLQSGRNYVELRSTSNGTYSGALRGLVAMGLYYSVTPTTNYAVRSLYDSDGPNLDTGALTGPSWMATNIGWSAGWHRMKAVMGSTQIQFYVDDVLAVVSSNVFGPTTWNCAVIGSGLTSGTTDVAFDNFKVEKVPEPATLLVLAAGGLFLRRRRMA